MSLKDDHCCWADIASHFWYFNEEECKARFRQIKPKGWKLKSKKQAGKKKADIAKNAAKVESIADEPASPKPWAAPAWE